MDLAAPGHLPALTRPGPGLLSGGRFRARSAPLRLAHHQPTGHGGLRPGVAPVPESPAGTYENPAVRFHRLLHPTTTKQPALSRSSSPTGTSKDPRVRPPRVPRRSRRGRVPHHPETAVTIPVEATSATMQRNGVTISRLLGCSSRSRFSTRWDSACEATEPVRS